MNAEVSNNINNKTVVHVEKIENANFVTTIEKNYPFKNFWSFDDYKSNASISFEPITKLTYPQLLFTNFKYENQTFPFFNPSIIRIDNMKSYYNFMLSFIDLQENRNVIYNTTYIVIGRWNGNQCEQSHTQFNESYFFHFQSMDYYKYFLTQNGILLLDKNFNILRHVPLKLSYDKHVCKAKQTKKCRKYLKWLHIDLQDCRLVSYLSFVFTYCISYKNANKIIGYIGALLWEEEFINDKIQIVAYLEIQSGVSGSETNGFFKLKQFYHKPNDSQLFGIYNNPKNLIALELDKKLYFQWQLSHSYFVEINIFNVSNVSNKANVFEPIESIYTYHNKQTFYSKHNINNSVTNNAFSYHQNVGFIHLSQTNELLGIGHIHYDLYHQSYNNNNNNNNKPYGIQYGHHYTHFFYTINDRIPFQVKRMSVEFCFNSPYVRLNSSTDCDVIQFVSGMVEKNEYLFLYYGINDCISSLVQIKKQIVIDMLASVKYIL